MESVPYSREVTVKKAAVLLSGCGNMDGSEIHESVAAIIALDRAGWELIYTAPDITQGKTVDYTTGRPVNARNVLQEAGRIARGKIVPLKPELADAVDAVVIPGGLGAVTTLCDFAEKGSNCTALPVVLEFLQRANRNGKCIAAMCIAPVLVARCIPGVSVTVGTDKKTADMLREMGCSHVECSASEAHADKGMKVVSTPAYMTAKGPEEVFRGAVEMVKKLDSLVSPS